MLIDRIFKRGENFFRFKGEYIQARLRNRGPVRSIRFFPESPHPYTIISKSCHVLGYRITKARRADLAIYWLDRTYREAIASDDPRIADLPTLNRHCTDISKRAVGKAQLEEFGYGCDIDPTEYAGPIVVKSDLNATHDGTIVHGPLLNAEPGYVYQKAIRNQDREGRVVDIRVPVFYDRIPFVYLKFRDEKRRFSNTNDLVVVQETLQTFSGEEIEGILRIARYLGLDVGEIDVLRDRVEGRIYVVDVNNTPLGPPNNLPPQEAEKARRRMSTEFETLFRRCCDREFTSSQPLIPPS